jgi:DNA invertase Pin-like site-specific DNA recombinase
MIAVLGGLADVERDLIRTRTAEGRSRAQKRGQHMGRPPKLTDAQKAEARRRRAQGATLAELASATAWARARFHDCDDEALIVFREEKDSTAGNPHICISDILG